MNRLSVAGFFNAFGLRQSAGFHDERGISARDGAVLCTMTPIHLLRCTRRRHLVHFFLFSLLYPIGTLAFFMVVAVPTTGVVVPKRSEDRFHDAKPKA